MPAEGAVAPAPKSEDGMWDPLDEIKLFLEGWKSTRAYSLKRGDVVRITISGKKRFKVHLAKPPPPRARKFESLAAIPDTAEWKGTWDIPDDGEYAIVVEPTGSSAFWVSLKIEKEYRPGRMPDVNW